MALDKSALGREIIAAIEEHKSDYKTLGPIELWVDAATGKDSNPGTKDAPLASIVEAERRLPVVIDHNVLIHVGPHTGAGYAPPTFRERILRANIDVIADSGGTKNDGFKELYTGVAQAGTAIQALKATAGLGVNTYRGKTIELLTGAQAGSRKTIADHTDDSIEPCVLWPPADIADSPAAGDVFRIVEPVTKIMFPKESIGSGTGAYWSISAGRSDQHTYGSGGITAPKPAINLINFIFDTDATAVVRINVGQAIRIFGCEATKALSLQHGAVAIGVDGTRTDFNYMLAETGSRIANVDAEAWVGWGALCTLGLLSNANIRFQGHGLVSALAIFYQVQLAELSGFNFHTGGVQILGGALGSGHVRLYGNYFGTSIRSRATSTGSAPAVEVRGGNAHCYISKTLMTSNSGPAALATEGGRIEFANNIDLVAPVGVKAQMGGRATFNKDAFETVNVTVNELEVGNSPTPGTIDGLATKGAYISEEDGSVIKRIT